MIFKTVFTIISFALIGCCSTQKQIQSTTTAETTQTVETTTNNQTMDSQKMIAAGYLLGTIVYSEQEGDCPYTIQMPGDKMEFYYLDPINLEEKYKKDGQ